MSGIDFARSDLPSVLLCELVLKDEFTFQIPALEIFPKTRGGGGVGHSSIIEDIDVCQGFSNHPLQTNGGTFSKIYTVLILCLAPLLGLAPPIRLQILISSPVRVSAPPLDKRFLQISLDFDQKDGEPELFLIN